MKTTKKLLSVLLSVLMILSTVSTLGMVSFAEDKPTYTVEIGPSTMTDDIYMFDVALINGVYFRSNTPNAKRKVDFSSYNFTFNDISATAEDYTIEMQSTCFDIIKIEFISSRIELLKGEGWSGKVWTGFAKSVNFGFKSGRMRENDTIKITYTGAHKLGTYHPVQPATCIDEGVATEYWECDNGCGNMLDKDYNIITKIENSPSINGAHTFVDGNKRCSVCGLREGEYAAVLTHSCVQEPEDINFTTDPFVVQDIKFEVLSEKGSVWFSPTSTAVDVVFYSFLIDVGDAMTSKISFANGDTLSKIEMKLNDKSGESSRYPDGDEATILKASGLDPEVWSYDKETGYVSWVAPDNETTELVFNCTRYQDASIPYNIGFEVVKAYHLDLPCEHNFVNGVCELCDEVCTHNYVDFVCTECGMADAAGKALADAKTEAVTAINAAKTEANATVAEKAITDINAAESVDDVNVIKATALTDMAKADEEAAAKALADAKTAAIAEINSAKTDDNKAVAEKAITDINAATNIDDVAAIKTQALTNMAKADADAAAKALADAKTAAIAEINSAKTDDNKAVAEKAITDINAATNIDDVAAIKTQALTDMAKADEDAAKALADAKAAAVAEVEAAKAAALNYAVENISTDAITSATTLAEVAAAKTEALNAVAAAEKELADAKTAAVNALETEAGADASDAVKAIVETAKADINNEHRVSRITTVKDGAVEAIKEQKAIEKAQAEAKALADAKAEAIEALQALVADEKATDKMKAIADEGIEAVNAATSIEEVEALLAEYTNQINTQKDNEYVDGDCPKIVTGFCFTFRAYRNIPVIGTFITIIHTIIHLAHSFGD